MSINYSIELLFPADRSIDVLREVNGMAARSYARSTVTVPDGSSMAVPFRTTSLDGSPRRRAPSLSPGNRVTFKSHLLFPLVDDIGDAVHEWQRQAGCWWGPLRPSRRRTHGYIEARDGVDYARLGMIFIQITLGQRFVFFEFIADSRDLSCLFRDSHGIQSRFLRLLHNHQGLLGIVDCELEGCRFLDDPLRSIAIDQSDFWTEDAGPEQLDVDAFGDAALRLAAGATPPRG